MEGQGDRGDKNRGTGNSGGQSQGPADNGIEGHHRGIGSTGLGFEAESLFRTPHAVADLTGGAYSSPGAHQTHNQNYQQSFMLHGGCSFSGGGEPLSLIPWPAKNFSLQYHILTGRAT
jgi:hypothetical protein